MALFRSEPNLDHAEKARIEFHLQQIGNCIGFDRFKLPVLSLNSIVDLEVEHLVGQFGEHLNHEVNGIRVGFELREPEKCGGGG